MFQLGVDLVRHSAKLFKLRRKLVNATNQALWMRTFLRRITSVSIILDSPPLSSRPTSPCHPAQPPPVIPPNLPLSSRPSAASGGTCPQKLKQTLRWAGRTIPSYRVRSRPELPPRFVPGTCDPCLAPPPARSGARHQRGGGSWILNLPDRAFS